MVAWAPIIKTLPFVVDILKIAVPAFTSKSDDKKPDEIIPEQISELQSAVTQNAESVKVLAEQLKETIEGIDAAGLKMQQQLVFLKRLCFFSVLLAIAGFITAIWSVFG